MRGSMIKTEQAQYAITNIIQAIRAACSCLIEKREFLEGEAKTNQANEDAATSIAIINLRIDTLAKIELKLLAPLIDEYKCMEEPIEHHKSGRLLKMSESRHADFIGSIMQGLE
jgi:hypothetical protein